MKLNSLQVEIIWYCAVLLLLLVGMVLLDAEIIDLLIAAIVLSLNWLIISFSIKKFGKIGSEEESINQELKWFVTFLVVFIIFLFVLSKDSTVVFIGITAYTLVWVLRSTLIKKFKKD